MTRIIGIAVVLFLMLGGGLFSLVKLGLWNSVSTIGWADKELTTRYMVDSKGFDVRAYEWIPAENPNVRMVFISGTKSSGVGSYTIANPEETNSDE